MRRKSIESKKMERCGNIKKILFYLVFISFCLSNLTLIFSVEIISCSSGGTDGFCEKGRACTCTISGECTNGNLLLYLDELTNPLCSPEIEGGSVSINWDSCNVTEGLFVTARADCDEGQSPEKTIRLSVLETTTTSILTTTSTIPQPETTTTTLIEETTHECGVSGYCEDVMAECQSGYEYCSEYNEECPQYDEKCCCPEKTGLKLVDLTLVFLIVLAITVGVVVFLFFITRMKKGMSFEKLYKKWAR